MKFCLNSKGYSRIRESAAKVMTKNTKFFKKSNFLRKKRKIFSTCCRLGWFLAYIPQPTEMVRCIRPLFLGTTTILMPRFFCFSQFTSLLFPHQLHAQHTLHPVTTQLQCLLIAFHHGYVLGGIVQLGLSDPRGDIHLRVLEYLLEKHIQFY